MVLLDEVVERTPECCVALWTVAASSPWVVDGRLLRAAFVEIAAQTAAAGAAGTGGAGPSRGYLGGITSFRVDGDARIGDRLRCTARRTTTFGPLARVECRIEALAPGGPRLVADGVLTVAMAQ